MIVLWMLRFDKVYTDLVKLKFKKGDGFSFDCAQLTDTERAR